MGRRACSLGDDELQVYEIDPPAQVAALPAPPGAPELEVQGPHDPAGIRFTAACRSRAGARAARSARRRPAASLHCYEADGSDVTTPDGPSLLSVAYSGLLTVPQVAEPLRVAGRAVGGRPAMAAGLGDADGLGREGADRRQHRTTRG